MLTALLERLRRRSARPTSTPRVLDPASVSPAGPSVGLAEAAFLAGKAARSDGRWNEALARFEECARLDPSHDQALSQAGRALLALDRPLEALDRLEQALALRPTLDDARYNTGLALRSLRRLAEAARVFEAFVADHPDDADAWNNLGCVLSEQRQHPRAIAAFDRAIALAADQPGPRFNKATAELECRRPDAAVETLTVLLRQHPEYPLAAGALLHARQQSCDWHDNVPLADAIAQSLLGGRPAIEPFALQAYAADPALQLACARLASPPASQRTLAQLKNRAPAISGSRLRIGYVSGEFRQQATSTLLAGVLEHHDRTAVEVFAFDNGWDDGSSLRRRIDAAVDRLVPIEGLRDDAAARCIADLGIDILIDLNGFFGLQRQGIFALRPAPIQVNYLGFPGTLGSRAYDYIVADHEVIPTSERMHYQEKVAYLPHSYQPSDPPLSIAVDRAQRRDHGLPDDALVFCCFNNNYKITPEVFDVWMELLRQVPEAILWLLADNDPAQINLRRAARARHVDADRLVFAARVPHHQHLARLTLADLFLDTTPCNAHTTANDALRCGLPVLTCMGRTFSSRVASSLLRAAGLPQLATSSLADYADQALRLASAREDLARLRRTLEHSAPTLPLFDTARYTRSLEAAYRTMWCCFVSGRAPADFTVEA